jgi:hypothetical protein
MCGGDLRGQDLGRCKCRRDFGEIPPRESVAAGKFGVKPFSKGLQGSGATSLRFLEVKKVVCFGNGIAESKACGGKGAK